MLKKGDYVCVFCGSKNPNSKAILEATAELGSKLGQQGLNLVYGGGGSGLMGLVASSTKQAGGHVVGIIPQALVRQEHNNPEIAETVVVKDMHTRKQMMNQRASAFIILPVGFGTFEEFLEISTWSLLNIHSKPIIALNTDGFYNPMKHMFQNAVQAGFVSSENCDLVVFADTVDDALSSLNNYTPPESRFILDWSQPATDII